jgi:TetR/AcrR family transcriptional regulator, cholesterol catabolism regulator
MEPREKILKTALSLFFKYGIRHVTMDEIARDLGMSKKTIYQFYKEKDDLVNNLCDNELKDHQVSFTKISKIAKDPIHEIMLISAKMQEMLQHINPVFFIDLQKFYPQAFARFEKFKEEWAYHHVLSNVKSGIEQGQYRSDLNVDFVSRYRMAQIDLLMFGNYFTYEKISFHRTHELVLDMFVYGICTVKGHKLFNHYKKINEEE